MNRIYLAGPLFCAGEKAYNEKITNILERAGYDVFLPQRDGVIAAEMEGKSAEQKVKIVFDKDTGAIEKSDILFFVLDGRVPDDGACVELGMAYAMGKRCYGLRTDVRALEDGMPLNPLIAGCFIRVFDDPDGEKALAELEDYLSNNAL